MLDYKGIKNPQIQSYNDCYKRYNKLYDWLIFFDIDEFIYLKDFTSLKLFINNKKFNRCNRVQFNWLFHTDNNLLYYENKPVKERFTEREAKTRGKKSGGSQGIKSVIRGNINNFVITDVHILNRHTRSCNGFGKRKKVKNIITTESDFDFYYIDHDYCKSTEEFINKVNKGCPLFSQDKNYKLRRIKDYFDINKITLEKIKMIETFTGFNLSEYKEKIK